MFGNEVMEILFSGIAIGLTAGALIFFFLGYGLGRADKKGAIGRIQVSDLGRVALISLIEELRGCRYSAAVPDMNQVFNLMEIAADEIEFLREENSRLKRERD